jgi:hypothetical protein
MRKWEGNGRIYCFDVARLTSILLCSSDIKQVVEERRYRGKGRDWRYSGNYFPYDELC